MEQYPARRPYGGDEKETCESREQAVKFMLNVVNATIYSSGQDYDGALEQFFPQLQALGHLIGAESLDEISAFLRLHCQQC